MKARPSGAVNACRRTVTDYAPDPVGIRMAAGLQSFLQRGIDGQNGNTWLGDKGRPEVTFNGNLRATPQAFSGAAALSMYGAAKPYRAMAGSFEDGQVTGDVFDNPDMRIFAARMHRRRR